MNFRPTKCVDGNNVMGSLMSASLRDSDTAVSGDFGAVYLYRLYYPCDGGVRIGIANLRA